MLARTQRGPRRALHRATAAGGPLYRQMVTLLKQEIVRGDYPVGTNLPTEHELCRRFKVSRHTVRQAVRQLREDGLVSSRQGAGTTVVPQQSRRGYVHTVASIEELIPYAAEHRFDVDATEIVSCGEGLARRLGCSKGERWLRIAGYRYADRAGQPTCWTEVYIRPQFSGVTRMLASRKGPIYAWIEDMYGERIDEVEQILRARSVPKAIAARLGVPSGAMVVEVCRVYRLTSGLVAEVAFNLHPADRFTCSMTLRRRAP